MKKPTAADKANVLSFCFVALTAFSENALSPTQKRWARERAENCLWALGIPEYKTDGATYTARELEEIMTTLDLEATKLLTEGKR
ncbi:MULTISPECIES: hypothetical protein [unclassified Agrobacterium]|uniref:hypothetical protein n=1 Tax=unclassified Agrobacterium TaxID=2632611 RepID=UPI00244D3883|nr:MULTISPECIES: hypothetical protein [unclassified Agrobacterium]MDH0612321.1 hypothetical protein [Agrobacterium sp. GD03872]MDH0696218.1 hypothetical protein [Agrobacterium sp. GD03871]MDH1059120.1 hypothetical protein [Agrobacterium sp. GD03992]MDH2210481.1 hypothetical protein [Agrobacterium sp. GD03643]MDH2217986.1 hypothetical protein [Agrobacterium sp. GD03638]